jgi:hypothetical protein
MAGKVARANEKRKARYKSHPSVERTNKERGQKTHVNALRKKLRHFARRVEAGKMTPAAFEAAKTRIEKEIAYTLGEIPRSTPNYKKGMRKRETEE